MRRSILALCTFVAACGVFGSEDSASDDAPRTPEENATPPVAGEPITGIFVSSSKGKDGDVGSNDRPVRTLKEAIALAKKQGQKVVACAETYEEDVVLVDGVSMYGYFDCSAEWRPIDRHATVRAKGSPAVSAVGIASATRIEGFDVFAPDFAGDPPSDAAKSSIGLDVRSSTSLTLEKVLVHAGTGGPGGDGQEGPANAESGSPNGAAGAPYAASDSCQLVAGCTNWTKVSGPAGGTSKCAFGPSGGPGGAGGDGKVYSGCTPRFDATRDPNGRASVATSTTAKGGVEYCAAKKALIPDPPYGKGTPGIAGGDGTDGSNGAWSLGRGGFVLGHGGKGGDGSPGQGGGGGGGLETWPLLGECNDSGCPAQPKNWYWTATGGSGGAGGCGGVAGTPGRGGGGSIAAFVIDSTIAIRNAKLESSQGGRAGKGTVGSAGLGGGSAGPATVYGGPGATGGHGGTSGLSGHGAPGPSIAIAFSSGKRPDLEGTQLVPGPAGEGQPELRKPAAAGAKVLPAVTGVSKAEHEI